MKKDEEKMINLVSNVRVITVNKTFTICSIWYIFAWSSSQKTMALIMALDTCGEAGEGITACKLGVKGFNALPHYQIICLNQITPSDLWRFFHMKLSKSLQCIFFSMFWPSVQTKPSFFSLFQNLDMLVCAGKTAFGQTMTKAWPIIVGRVFGSKVRKTTFCHL